MAEHTPYQRKIIERYYKNLDGITLHASRNWRQTFISPRAKKGTGSGVAWTSVSGNWRFPAHASRCFWRSAIRHLSSAYSRN